MNPPDYKAVPDAGTYPQPTNPVIVQQPTEQYSSCSILGITRGHQLMTRMLPAHLGEAPVDIVCPNCQSQIRTETKKVYGYCQWWTFILLISFLLFMFAWIPFVFPSMKDTVHTCPRCKGYVGFERVCCAIM